jgi:hypothetical protein
MQCSVKMLISKAASLVLSTALVTACGGNPLKSYETKDPAEDAAVALEQGNPDKAISILTSALEDEPGHTRYISLLAMAYAERGGIDAVTLALKMASNGSSNTGSSSGTGVSALFSVLPEATDARISDVDTAISLMAQLPADALNSAEKLKIAMFQTAALTLRTKKYDLDGDGIISAAEALAMSGTDATAILSNLASAAAVFAGSSSTSSTDQAAAAQITGIQTAISNCPGATQQAKLQNYVSRTGC